MTRWSPEEKKKVEIKGQTTDQVDTPASLQLLVSAANPRHDRGPCLFFFLHLCARAQRMPTPELVNFLLKKKNDAVEVATNNFVDDSAVIVFVVLGEELC
jgi:hypothetical protein